MSDGAWVSLVPLVACVVCGALLLLRRSCTIAGYALVAGGALAAGGLGLIAWLPGSPLGPFLLVAGTMIGLPLAVWAYPRPMLGHSVDLAFAVTSVGPGLVAVLDPADPVFVGTLAMVTVIALVAQTWWRIERTSGEDRRALLWMSVAAASAGSAAGLLTFAFDGQDAIVIPAFGLLAVIPVAMVIGVLPESMDVRGVVVHVVVTLLVAMGYIAYFVGVVSTAHEFGADQLPAGVLGLVGLVGAWLVRPATIALRGVIDQMLFGDRPDPLDAATRVAGQLGDDPVLALEAIRDALTVPFVQLRVDGRVLATSGSEVTSTSVVPLPLGPVGERRDDREGELVVGLRPGDLRLGDGDVRVLRLVAPLLVQVLRARSMAAAVRRSRDEAIGAIADERRRLRRDLHDGLGPTLTGIAFSVDAARNLVHDDPEAAAALLTEIRADTVGAIDQIRRLVYGMRPPALDEVGLVPALRLQARGLRRRDGEPLEVTVTADGAPAEGGPAEGAPAEGAPPDLSAAVEVAAYRIVVEALTNVAKHAKAKSAMAAVRYSADALVLEITDDAQAGPAWTPGVGLTSMRERAEEVGGSLTCGPTPVGGLVRAVLPLGETGRVRNAVAPVAV